MSGRLGLGTPPGLAEHLAHYGPLPTVGARHGSRPGRLVDEVERAGLRGRGGGWFPTHLKLRAVVESSDSRSRLSRTRNAVVIANGMEGEPASGKDAVLLTHSPHLALDGIAVAARTVGATDAFIAVHRGSPAVPALERALDERERSRIDDLTIRIVTPPARYVASEESALAHFVGDGIALPVTVPPRVFESGVRRRPTFLSNAETYAHIALIARRGSGWFREVGDPAQPGTMLVSVSGAVAQPGVVEVPTGTTMRQILGLAGGTTGAVSAAVTGGYGGSWVSAGAAIDLPFSVDGLRPIGGVPGAGVLAVLPTDACGLVETARVVQWMAGQSAGQCGPCRFGLAAVSQDFAMLAGGKLKGTGLAGLEKRLGIIPGRGACRHPDGAVRFAASALDVFGDEVQRHLSGHCSAGRRTFVLPVPAGKVDLPVARPGEEWR